jgi:hypothetical protein
MIIEKPQVKYEFAEPSSLRTEGGEKNVRHLNEAVTQIAAVCGVVD